MPMAFDMLMAQCPPACRVTVLYLPAHSQVLLRWSLQKGFVTLPKSVNPERQRANAELSGWELSDADMAEMDSWEADLVTGWDPIRDHPV